MLRLWCSTPLSTTFQLYRVGQFLLVEEIGVLGENLRPVVSHNILSGSFRLDFGTVLTVWYGIKNLFIFIFFQIKVVPGALDCWSFVSALEVLQSCELYEDLHNTELFYLYRATLWDHARKKVYL